MLVVLPEKIIRSVLNLTPYNSQTTAGVPLGYYYVSVIDERGCFADDYIDIDSVTNSFNTSSIQYTSQDVSCYNGSNGEINISNISGGVGTFLLDINNMDWSKWLF